MQPRNMSLKTKDNTDNQDNIHNNTAKKPTSKQTKEQPTEHNHH